MNEYKFLKEFYSTARIVEENIIIQEVDIFNNNVCLYIVTKEKNMFDVYTAVGDIDKPVGEEHINHVLLFQSQIKGLLQKIE